MLSDHTFAVCAYKESPYLEKAILSLKAQTVPSRIIIETSTPCTYINNIAAKYNIPVYVNEGKGGITEDWNYAYSKCDTKYVTIAHQDDVYLPDYTKNMLSYLQQAKQPLIFFTDYAELRESQIVESNRLLEIKRLMLLPLRFKTGWNKRWLRRRILSFGCPILCPSVTFVRENLPEVIFRNHYLASEDWEAWENLSKLDGSFVYCCKILTYHRIHAGSTTTLALEHHTRTKEDYEMFCKFWPKWIAKILIHFYSKSEKSNQL